MNHPVDKLAAHLAHVINTGPRLEAGAVYLKLVDALAGPYAGPVLGQPAYAWRMSEEEAAQAYFEHCLSRPVLLTTGKLPLSMAHRVLHCLLQAVPTQAPPVLERAHDAPGRAFEANLGIGPLKHMANAWSGGSTEISKGSASPTLLERHGPIWLIWGDQCLPVPEELSLWQVIMATPPTRQPQPSGEGFHQLCSLLIDLLRTLHRPFQEAAGMGLCPFDWMDVLSINQMKSIRAWLGTKTSIGGDGQAAWEHAPVTGFRSYDEFRHSEIGRALLSGGPTASAMPVEELADVDLAADDDTPAVLAREEFASDLHRHVDAQRLHAVEAEAVLRLYHGFSLLEVAAEPDFSAWLSSQAMSVKRWAATLPQRLSA